MNQSSQTDNPSAASRPSLQVYLLGRFQVNAGGQPVADRQWRLRKSRSLIKLLALAPQHRLHREQLLDALWPDLPAADAAHNLHQVLYIARRGLDPEGGANQHLQLQDDVLSLGPESALWIDVEAFETAVAHARQTRELAAYRAALDLYSGDLLPDDRYEDWGSARRETLHRTYLELLSALVQRYEHDLEYAAAIDTANRVLASDPAQEEAHRSLMRLYALSGRRAQALRQYQQLTESLRREVDAEPDSESERLYQQILAGQFAPQTTEQPSETSTAPPQAAMSAPQSLDMVQPIRSNNLPLALDSFVGREVVMIEVKSLLARSRLVMLTGSGGCGKTRLSIQVASELAATYPDGVWLVEFAALSDPTLLAQEVARALDVRERPGQPLLNTLIDTLRNKDILLLFDNCEHLITACAQLAEALLRTCPRLRILATSREALHIAGEANYRVPSMIVPVGDQLTAVSAQQGMQYEAVHLFADRAAAANRSFRLTNSNASAVAEICAQLDGMPLAIELAAARVTSLSAEQIAARLEDRFRLLTGGSRTAMPRQQTLQAAIDWSYSLLTEPERILLRRLSVFVGGWTLEAGEDVCSDEERSKTENGGRQTTLRRDGVLDILTRLVDKSLVTVGEAAGEIRYEMLETIRQFAYESLEESGEEVHIRDRHLEFFLRFAEKAGEPLHGEQQMTWLNLMKTDYDNLRAGLSWSKVNPDRVELGLRLASSLIQFWLIFGYWSEGRDTLDTLLSGRANIGPAVLAKMIHGNGLIAMRQGDNRLAESLFENSLLMFREIEDPQGVSMTLCSQGNLALRNRRYAAAQSLFEDSLLEAKLLKDKLGSLNALNGLGRVATDRGDFMLARSFFEQSAILARELGDLRGVSGLGEMAWLALNEGDYARALTLYEEILPFERMLLNKWQIANTLNNLGVALLRLGDFSKAKAVLVESLTIENVIQAKQGIARLLHDFGSLALAQGQVSRAVWLYGASTKVFDNVGVGTAYSPLESDLSIARTQLGEVPFNVAWATGRALTMEQAVALALSDKA